MNFEDVEDRDGTNTTNLGRKKSPVNIQAQAFVCH